MQTNSSRVVAQTQTYLFWRCTWWWARRWWWWAWTPPPPQQSPTARNISSETPKSFCSAKKNCSKRQPKRPQELLSSSGAEDRKKNIHHFPFQTGWTKSPSYFKMIIFEKQMSLFLRVKLAEAALTEKTTNGRINFFPCAAKLFKFVILELKWIIIEW